MNTSSARKLRGEGPTKYPKPAASMDNVEFFSDEFYYPKPERSPCVGMCHRSSELGTNLREVWSFTISEKAPTRAFSWLKVPYHFHLQDTMHYANC